MKILAHRVIAWRSKIQDKTVSAKLRIQHLVRCEGKELGTELSNRTYEGTELHKTTNWRIVGAVSYNTIVWTTHALAMTQYTRIAA